MPVGRIIKAFLLVIVIATLVACHTDDEVLILENKTSSTLRLVRDGKNFFSEPSQISPDQVIKTTGRPSEWRRPNRLQALDEQGNVRFDETLTWDDLKARDFRIVFE